MKAVGWLIRLLLLALVFGVILMRPGYGERTVHTEVADVEVMLVVDRTRSMAAVDYDDRSPRVDGVRRDVHDLVDALPGVRFSLVTWGSDARLELPFTSDTTAVTGAVDTMTIENPYDGTGTLVDTPLEVMSEELARAEKQYPDRRRMLVFISDGENTASGRQRPFGELEPYVDGGLVLGYGTERGAPMPLADDLSDKDGYVRFEGKEALSKADPANLRRIAEETGTTYVTRSKPGGIEELTAGFEGEYTTDTGPAGTAQHDLTWVAGLVLFALLLWELRVAWRTVWTAPGALGGRNGRRKTGPAGAKR